MCFLSKHFPYTTIETFHGIKKNRQPECNDSIFAPGLDLIERGAELLRYLDTRRDEHLQDDPNADAPRWVFVCHDIGGCVLEQALVLAHSEPYYHWVQQSIAAMVFIDTPSSSLRRHERETLILHTLASLKSTLGLDMPSIITSLVKSIDKSKVRASAVLETHHAVTLFSTKTLGCQIGEVMEMTGDEPAAKIIIEVIKQHLEKGLNDSCCRHKGFTDVVGDSA
ncbi:hypothetical protein F4677DRAFT_414591 [Hypoxylon crocopeplum]|nr:hypothetical protein F4677DRAFT_414591 [Hypoxylon crocopeplum]